MCELSPSEVDANAAFCMRAMARFRVAEQLVDVLAAALTLGYAEKCAALTTWERYKALPPMT